MWGSGHPPPSLSDNLGGNNIVSTLSHVEIVCLDHLTQSMFVSGMPATMWGSGKTPPSLSDNLGGNNMKIADIIKA